MQKLVVFVALAAFGCDEEGSDPSPMLIVPQDVGVEVDAFRIDPDRDDGVPPDPDRGVEPDPDRGVAPDPDRGVDPPDPDMAVVVPLENAIATVTVVEQPETAELSVAVTRFVEPMPVAGDCQLVRVDPDDPPEVVAQLEAGPITIDGLSGGPFTFSLVGGKYQSDRGVPDDLFGDGTNVRASAGGALPFDLSIQAPGEVALQSPTALESYPARQDLVVRWNGEGADAALITVFPLENFTEPARGEWLFCGAADSGIFTVRGADLAEAAGDSLFPGAPNALVAVTRIRTVSQAVGSNRAILTVTTSNGAPVALE